MRKTLTVVAAVSALMLTAPAAASAAEPHRWELYGNVSAPRECSVAERRAVRALPEETCTRLPRPAFRGQLHEDGSWS